jgi:hypothetical protein
MFPNGNVGLENSKFYEDVPARGHIDWSRRLLGTTLPPALWGWSRAVEVIAERAGLEKKAA